MRELREKTLTFSRDQYERFPYPPVPFLALPRRGEGARLRFKGAEQKINILVCGGGTFEPLVVAQAHPHATRVTVIDFSRAALQVLRRRLTFARLLRRLPPIELIHADLTEWEPASTFHYVLASNVLHHLDDPGASVKRLASWLMPGGFLRLVTYPKASRAWMRETSRWLKAGGLSPDTPRLAKKALKLVRELPPLHPVRLTLENHPERGTDTGVVDAFFHACERPLSPAAWGLCALEAGLTLVEEGQDADSRSDFVNEIFPELQTLDPWSKLQFLDDLLELCANPVLWLKQHGDVASSELFAWGSRLTALASEAAPGASAASVDAAIEKGLLRAAELAKPFGLSAEAIRERLKREVGPRVDARGRAMPGLSLGG